MEPQSYNRYILREKKLNRFFRPKTKSFQWEDADFCSDIADAKHYITRSNAIRQMVALSTSRDVEMVTVSVTVKPTSTETVTARDVAAREYAPLVLRVDAMSNEDVETLPREMWKEYVFAKNELKNMGVTATELIKEYEAK